jgi:gas vesicle protein
MLLATLAGLTGAAVALLLAPSSGKETREKIKSRAHDLKEQAKNRAQSAKADLDAKMERAKGAKNREENSISKQADRKEEI